MWTTDKDGILLALLAAEILDAPQAFYANIHTVDFPPGAIRGQLEPGTIFDLELS